MQQNNELNKTIQEIELALESAHQCGEFDYELGLRKALNIIYDNFHIIESKQFEEIIDVPPIIIEEQG